MGQAPVYALLTFLARVDTDLTTQSFAEWCRTQDHLTSGVRRSRMRVVRNLCLYRQRTKPRCFVPDTLDFPPLHQPIQPHIFTEQEIVRLLTAADRLRPGSRSPLHRENMRLAIVLLYTTGLRRGELLRLKIGDYDIAERTLLVRESKFHKSRLLPLSSDGAAELEASLKIRQRRGLPSNVEMPLLWNRNSEKNGYSGTGIAAGIRNLFRATSIRTVIGNLPRIHDLRHSFAVNALLRWYRSGEDVQAKLPLLATYMGHVSISSTEYYLHFIADIAVAASERFAERCGAIVSVARVGRGEP